MVVNYKAADEPSRMRDLIVDMDDTKHPFHMPFYEFHERTYGPNDRIDPARSIRENLGLDDDVASARILEFYERTDPETLKPVPGLAHALDRMAERYRIWVFTARDESAGLFTEKWMRLHLSDGRIPSERVIHTSSDRFRTRRSKLDVARERGLDVAGIVEDSLPTAREFARAGISAFLVPYPWNELEEEDRDVPIMRASSLETAWAEFTERLLSTQI